MKRRLFILSSFFFLSPLMLFVCIVSLSLLETRSSLSTPQGSTLLTQTLPALKQSYVPLLTDSFNQPKSISSQTLSGDARPVIIKKYLDKWKSPFSPQANLIVDIADQFNIDPMIVVAIAQQESNLGKNVIPNCYNAWGWAQTSVYTRCFSSWEDGISSFIKEFSAGYIQKGLVTPEQIMTRYNATSPGGSWAKGVSQFLEELTFSTSS